MQGTCVSLNNRRKKIQMERTFDTNRTFADLGVIPPILKALEEMGFEHPTEVQSQAIPHVLDSKDLIVMAKTGSGKTAVFGVSLLQLTDPEAEGPQGLILTPTRELAVQVDSDIRKMAKFLAHRTAVVYGQHSIGAEVKELEKGATIVTGTPGRVYDHISQGTLNTRHISFLVLDEADRMLDMGFIDQVERIIRAVPKNRTTMLFSATMPDEVKRICRRYMKEPETIETESQTKTVDSIRQLYYRVDEKEKHEQLNRVLLTERPESCMIFCNTRIAADKVGRFLDKKGYACRVLHGDIPQSRRIKTIQHFKQGKFRMLIATDVAARGIHIDELSLVINYDVPQDKDSYVHRIGRTGRAGHEGRAVSIVTRNDIMDLYAIEEHIGTLIEESELPGDDYMAEHSQEIEEWVKANSISKTEAAQPSQSKSGKDRRERTRQDGRKKAGTGNSRKGAYQKQAGHDPDTDRLNARKTGPKDIDGRPDKDPAEQEPQDFGKQKQHGPGKKGRQDPGKQGWQENGKQKRQSYGEQKRQDTDDRNRNSGTDQNRDSRTDRNRDSETGKPRRHDTKPFRDDTQPLRHDTGPLRKDAAFRQIRGQYENAGMQKSEKKDQQHDRNASKSEEKAGFFKRILNRIPGK